MSAGSWGSAGSWRSPARALLLLALLIFLGNGLWLDASLPVWHEGVSTHANRPSEVVVVEPGEPKAPPTIAPSCADEDAPVIVRGTVRPVTALCAGGLTWPLLISPYAAGVTYWPLQLLRPLHRGEPLALRRVSLLTGLLSLWVLFALVARYRDEDTAAVTVLVASVLSGFLHMHALLVAYEPVPTLLLLTAALVLDGGGGREPASAAPRTERAGPTWLRLGIAGALVGLALASNIKALVVGAPLLVLALWRVPRMRAPGLSGWAVFVAGLALVAGPFLALALSDPHAGVSGQVSKRLDVLLANLAPGHLLAEVDNALIYFADFGFYLDIAAGEPAPLPLWLRLLPLLALGYASVSLVRLLWGRACNVVAAAAGAVLWTFILFAALFYGQTPAANYGPVVHVHAIALGAVLVDGGRALARRWPAHGRALLAGVVALGVAVLALATHRHGDRRDHMPLSIDVHALETLSAWLRAHDDHSRVVVTTYNLVGVLDAMAAGSRPTLALNEAMRACPKELASCRVDRLVAFFQTRDEPLRVIVPLRVGPIDERGADQLVTEVCAAAQVLGRRCDDELRVATRTGVEVVGVLRVE